MNHPNFCVHFEYTFIKIIPYRLINLQEEEFFKLQNFIECYEQKLLHKNREKQTENCKTNFQREFAKSVVILSYFLVNDCYSTY